MSGKDSMEEMKRKIRESLADIESEGGKSELSRLVEQFIQEYYDRASFSVTLQGVDVDWPNETDTVEIDGEMHPADEPFLHLHFRYWHENATDDPREPFMNRVPWVKLHCTDADGDWHIIDWLEPDPGDDLYAEVKGRYAPSEGQQEVVKESIKGFINDQIDRQDGK